MRGDYVKLLRHAPLGDRYAGRARHRDRTGDSRYDGDWHPGPQAGEHLLAAPAEDERIAALEPDHEPPGQGVRNQDGVDVILLHGRAVRDLGRVDDLDIRRQFIEQRLRGEPVDHHNVGLAEQLPAPHGDQPRVARPAAHQRHTAMPVTAAARPEGPRAQAGEDRVTDTSASLRVCAENADTDLSGPPAGGGPGRRGSGIIGPDTPDMTLFGFGNNFRIDGAV